jgi:hypothetical protein
MADKNFTVQIHNGDGSTEERIVDTDGLVGMQDGYDLSPGGAVAVPGTPHHDFDAYPSAGDDDMTPR